METWNIGQRVKVAGQSGYIYGIDHDWAAVVLDKNAGKRNAPITWAKFDELEKD
jgi:hypothetical protein